MCGESYFRPNFAVLLISALLYGIYFALFLVSAYVCAYNRRNNYFLIVTTVMFVVGTVVFAMSSAATMVAPDFMARSYCDGLACFPCNGNSQARADQITRFNLLNAVVGFLWVVNNIFADSIMIYRDYIFWQKNVWITALPILALLGTTVSGFYEDYLLLELALFPQSPNQLAPPSKFVALSNLESTVDGASTVLVMVTNILTTLLIVSRIWWMTRGMRETLGLRTAKRYHQIMAMMVESGAIYAISLLICAIFKFDLGLSGLGGPIYAVATQLQTIAPTLIIIRVRIKECVEDTTLGQSNPVAAPPTFSPIPARRSDRQESMLGGGMQEIVVVEGGSLELTTMGGDAHEVSIESLRG